MIQLLSVSALTFTAKSDLVTPRAFHLVARIGGALVFALTYLTMEIRRFYHGPVLSSGGTTGAEPVATTRLLKFTRVRSSTSSEPGAITRAAPRSSSPRRSSA